MKTKGYEIMEAILILDPDTTDETLASIEEFNGLTGQEAKMAAIDYACQLACSALAVVLRDYYYEETFLN